MPEPDSQQELPGMSMFNHTLLNCPQNPVLLNMTLTLRRLDAHTERTAIAMEAIAAQGAIIGSHEKRLDKNDLDTREVFKRLNDTTKADKLTSEVVALEGRVTLLEKAHAKEEGAEEIEARLEAQQEEANKEKRKFWTELKIKLITPVMFTLFFSLWLIDKWSLAEKFKALLREFQQ